MKRAARLAELEQIASPTRAQQWEMQELRRRIRENASLRQRYQGDQSYRFHKMRQRATAYYRQRHMEAAE